MTEKMLVTEITSLVIFEFVEFGDNILNVLNVSVKYMTVMLVTSWR